MSNAIEISVVVCTRNRAPSLAATLASLAAQTLDAARFEVVVVDNGPTDDTPDLLARTPGVRAIVEPRVGLSAARNTGVKAAAGEVVAFIATTTRSPARTGSRASRRDSPTAPSARSPGASSRCGRRRVRCGCPTRSFHISRSSTGAVARASSSAASGSAGPTWRSGAALSRAGGFSEALGRRDGVLLSNEEVLVQRRLAADGVVACYDPAVVVGHRVPAERVAPDWLARRAFWQGVSNAICDRLAADVVGAPPWLRCAGSAAATVATPWRLAGRGTRGIEPRCKALLPAGYVLGWTGLVTGMALPSPRRSRTLGR